MSLRAHRVVPNLYRDSVALMQLAAALLARPAVRRATAAMATPANLDQAADAGLLPPDLACAPDDLLIVVEADDGPGAEAALAWAVAELARPPARAEAGAEAVAPPRTLAEGRAQLPAALAFIAAPGPYAAAEAMKALRQGLHVMLFSSGVSLEDEAALKGFAAARGLLMLGAECGTAIIGGAPLGFANQVRRGSIGIAAASGTGLQELCCLIHRWGGGVSHAIGVGGRDLAEQVGGTMTLAALRLLFADPATAAVVLLSKPPAPAVAARIAAAAAAAPKPVVLALLGADQAALAGAGLPAARTLEDAARLALAAVGLAAPALADPPVAPAPPPRRFVRGLFAGGTLCAEAALILGERLGPVVSPADDDPLPAAHSCLDLGDERFTQGRPHPMIDAGLRAELMARAARDPLAAALLFDVVLGYGAADDPVGPLLAAVSGLAPTARPELIAHVCGTDDDPQGYARQVARLATAGVTVAATNAQAARLAAAAAAAREAREPESPGAQEPGSASPSHPPSPSPEEPPMGDLLHAAPGVLVLGPGHFAVGPAAAGAPTLALDWRPPARGDAALARLLAALADDREGPGALIAAANRRALARLTGADPLLVDVLPAREALRDLGPATVLHAGPPVSWEQMCGPMRGAVIGALRFEGLAASAEEAAAMVAAGAVELAPCHSRDAVGPMAGVISASMPVLVVDDVAGGTRAFANLNEGLGRVLRFGAYDNAVLERLRWMQHTLAPALGAALRRMGGLSLKGLIARALHMGDEVHNRNAAASGLLFKALAPQLAALALPSADLVATLEFLAQHEHFFLNCSMAACKAALLAASAIPHSTLVTAMARNGVATGIQVSGLGPRWFTAPAPIPQGLYFPGYSEADANPDLGDSAITETAGLGAFAMAAAPAIVRFVGGTPAAALRATEEMYPLTLGEHPAYTLPALDFRGTPVGIDVRRVVERGAAPIINTGIAHREPGFGNIGAGVVAAPLACFEQALQAMGAWLPEGVWL